MRLSKLTNAMLVLRAFSTKTPELTVTGMASALNLPMSSTSRLMKEMREQDLLEQDPHTRLYRPGFFLYQLGMIYETHLRLFKLLVAEVEDLVRSTGHTGYIGLLDNGDMHALRTINGAHPFRYVVDAGRRVPAYAVTGGLCLLSRMSDEEISRLYPEPFVPAYPTAAKSLGKLLLELKQIRKLGWAEKEVSTSTGTRAIGVRAIGVSVASADGKEAFGYSLSFPDQSLNAKEITDLRERLVASARALGAQTGDQFWTHFG